MAKIALLQMEWDSYEPPNEFSVFGLTAESQIPGLPDLVWKAGASEAWGYLVRHGYVPVSWTNGQRIPTQGYKRPVTVKFKQEASYA